MAEIRQTKVRVSFDYYPSDPDPDDSTGMSEAEYIQLNNQLAMLGADDVEIERQDV